MNSNTKGATVNSTIEAPTGSPVMGAAAALVGRVFLAAIFLVSGIGKLAAPAATISYIASAGLPFPQLGLAIAVCVEILGGLALVAGYRTRIAAAALAVFSVAAALSFHAHFGDENQFIHFMKNIAVAGGMMQVFAFGGGGWSLDARKR